MDLLPVSEPDLTPSQAYGLVAASRLHPAFNGSQGENRGAGRQQIAANTDWDAIQLWLVSYQDSPLTYQAYVKEVTRFYVWVLVERRRALSSATFEDWQAYWDFMANPQPRELWVNPRRVARTSSEYRPFSGPLSDSSRRTAKTILATLFGWLHAVGYLAGNPILKSRRRGRAAPVTQERFLTEESKEAVLASIADYPEKTDAQRKKKAQARWLFQFFLLTGLRISEAVGLTTDDLYSMRDRARGQDVWFLRVLGKGDKERSVPVTSLLRTEMERYRAALGLPSWPAPGLSQPLILSRHASRRNSPLTRQAVHLAMKELLENAAGQVDADSPGIAAAIRHASTHWLRHTAATDILEQGVHVKVARDLLGHASLQTTSIYSHTEKLSLHQEVEAAQAQGATGRDASKG